MIRQRRVKSTLAVKGEHGSMHLSSRGLIAGGLLVGLFATACGSQQQPAAPIATPTPKASVVGAESVRRGDIQQILTYSGDIRAREQISVMPRAGGRVEQILVDVGARVSAGDTLAILDHDTAEIAVFTARANLAGVESRLANIRSGGRTDDTAVAQASLLATQSSLASADAALNNLKGTAPADIQQAQSTYDQAVAQLRSAVATLEQSRHPTQSAIADAEAGLEQARAQRQQAQAQQSALEKNVSGACVNVPGMPRNGTACGDARTAASAGVSAGNA